MFNKRPETKIALAVLFIGWLTLGSPTASFAADHADAAGSKAAAASDARADRDDSGRNEAQAPPAAQRQQPLLDRGWSVVMDMRLATLRLFR